MLPKVTFTGEKGIPFDVYSKYINSRDWKERRQERIEHDNGRCRTCRHTENIQVHHVSYANFGNEPLDDLITLCADCHEAITNILRKRRHHMRKIQVGNVAKPQHMQETIRTMERKDHVRKSSNKHKGSDTVIAPQWRLGKPIE